MYDRFAFWILNQGAPIHPKIHPAQGALVWRTRLFIFELVPTLIPFSSLPSIFLKHSSQLSLLLFSTANVEAMGYNKSNKKALGGAKRSRARTPPPISSSWSNRESRSQSRQYAQQNHSASELPQKKQKKQRKTAKTAYRFDNKAHSIALFIPENEEEEEKKRQARQERFFEPVSPIASSDTISIEAVPVPEPYSLGALIVSDTPPQSPLRSDDGYRTDFSVAGDESDAGRKFWYCERRGMNIEIVKSGEDKELEESAETYKLEDFKIFQRFPPEIRCMIVQIAIQDEDRPRRLVVFMDQVSCWYQSSLIHPGKENSLFFPLCNIESLDGPLIRVNREFRGEFLRNYPHLLPTLFVASHGLDDDVMKCHFGKHDSIAIRNVEAALLLWKDADSSTLNTNPFALYDPSARGNIHGDWSKGIRSLILPSSVLRFLRRKLQLSKFLYDLPALNNLKFLMQVNSQRDSSGQLFSDRAEMDPEIVIAESHPITRDFVCGLEIMRKPLSDLTVEEMTTLGHVAHMLTCMDRDREEIERYLTIRSGFHYKFPKMTVHGFRNWQAEVALHRN